MKKILSLLLCLPLLLGICLLSSCCKDDPSPAPSTIDSPAPSTIDSPAPSAIKMMDFEAKYVVNGYSYYLFHSDGTGEYVIDHTYEYEYLENYTVSGTVEFVWREASDGAIYLFKTEERYNENHTDGYSLGIITEPIYFGEDFFAYTRTGAGNSYTTKFVREGSSLDLSAKK